MIAGGHRAAGGQLLDTKPYVEHHPIFGYRYIPGTNLELARPAGGSYHFKVNSQGIRSDREYFFEKPGSFRRIIVCGDSMAAGQFLSNSERFSELLERRVPGLEIINLALEGSGTDQQVLLYEYMGLQYEHDIVLLMPFLQNVRRNMVEAREAIDPKTGETVFRPKPRFELVDGKLVLRNVPVPREVFARDMRKKGATDAPRSWQTTLKAAISALPGSTLFKRALYSVMPWEPFPEYRDASSREWRLMSALILRLAELAKGRPVIVAPTFYSNYVRFRMARNYWDRYKALSTAGAIRVIDLLPHFRRLGTAAVRCFQEPYDMHFSAFGNLVLADALEQELRLMKMVS